MIPSSRSSWKPGAGVAEPGSVAGRREATPTVLWQVGELTGAALNALPHAAWSTSQVTHECHPMTTRREIRSHGPLLSDPVKSAIHP